MKKHKQYFILIGIVSLALGIGVGFLIKKGMTPKDESANIEATEIPAIDHEQN